ncbi:MAG TPA: rRNA maturation RNase YbeY [Fermentimonas sp.]|nr:rRNA maturation RNase YbeY [Fermentimonas sp.]
MSITFDSENIDFPNIKKRETASWIKSVAKGYEKEVGEIAYIFCNDEKILEINRQFLKHDFYTDIISFDYSEDEIISGDIFISLDTVLSNSQMYNTDYQDELHRVIIHGVLHLCGFDDDSEENIMLMKEAEDASLKLLKESK